jgi:hypothetical protein
MTGHTTTSRASTRPVTTRRPDCCRNWPTPNSRNSPRAATPASPSGDSNGATSPSRSCASRFSIRKYEIWARDAFVETQPYAPQDAWLGVVSALDDFRRTIDYDTIASLIQQSVEATNPDGNIFAELEREFDRAAVDTINGALASHPNVSGTGAFRQRFDFHRKAWKVTEDLNDERFTIRVEMPGQIVAHNGDNRAGNIVTWTFAGEFLHDRTIELLVTSRVAD